MKKSTFAFQTIACKCFPSGLPFVNLPSDLIEEMKLLERIVVDESAPKRSAALRNVFLGINTKSMSLTSLHCRLTDPAGETISQNLPIRAITCCVIASAFFRFMNLGVDLKN